MFGLSKDERNFKEAKAKAEREAAIRRNAYIKGQNDARASCRGSTSC